MTILVFAPNWLGDVVMALPAMADVIRHAGPSGRVVVAARPGVSGLFACVPGLDGVVTLAGTRERGLGGGFTADARAVAEVGADAALLMPNALRAALVAWRAGVPGRWGYRHEGRGVLLTRAIRRPRGLVHQVDYYRRLVAALGIDNGAREPRLEVPRATRDAAAQLLVEHGWTPGTRLVGMAPGAAYGGAKRWMPERFAQVSIALARSHHTTTVLVGSPADAPTAWAIEKEIGKIAGTGPGSHVIDLAGRTDLPQLCGVLAQCAALLSNDSGAMHVAAAVGVPVVALFGPTNEQETAPVSARAAIMRAPVWCRPCMLRECPLDHRCMTGIGVDAVTRVLGEIG